MANNTLIGALRAEATLESGKFVDGAKKIRKEAKETEAQLKTSFSAMGAAVKGFGGALTAGLSIGLLGGLAKKALDYATSIKDVAAQAGVATKSLQEFRYAASQMGIKQAEADKGLTKLNETLGKAAAGSASAQKALAAVGVTMADIQTKSRTEIFGQIADQMIKQGGAAKNAAAANVIFGESASKLNPLLDQGSKGIDELAQAANRLGVVLSDSQIQQADETARKLDDVRQVLAAQIAGVVADNASSIVTLAEALASLTSAVVNFLGSNPQLALGIIGALAGGRAGGLPGAAAGALVGLNIGAGVARRGELGDNDLKTRAAALRKARAEYTAAKQMGGRGGAIATTETGKRLREELDATRRALAQRKQPPATGNIPLPQFLAPEPKKGRKGRTPRAPRDRSDDVAFQFDMELRRAHADVLRAQQSIATTSDERARIALELLDAERGMQEAELNDRVRRAERDFAEGKINEATLEQAKVQADKLRAEFNSRDAIERKAIADDLAADKARDAASLADSAKDIELEKLQLEASLAKTAKEKRSIELRILDLMKAQEKARLEAVIADKDSSELARAEAQQRLDQIDAIYEGREGVVRDQTKGPLESVFGDLPMEADEYNEALENVAANGIKSLEDGILDVITGTKSLKEAFHDMAQQILADLLRIAIQKYIIGTIMSAIGSAAGGIGGGSSSSGSPQFTPSNPGVGFATGGFVSGRGGPTADRIPAMLSAGEFVINAKSTKRFLPLLKRINQGEFSRLAMGGLAIPQRSFGERVSGSNDNNATPGMGPMSITINGDFRGADPAAVGAIQNRLNQMEAELPSRVVQAYQDAKSRFVIRN